MVIPLWGPITILKYLVVLIIITHEGSNSLTPHVDCVRDCLNWGNMLWVGSGLVHGKTAGCWPNFLILCVPSQDLQCAYGNYWLDLMTFCVTFLLFYNLCNYIYIFSFICISWRLITLQYCNGFCHTLTWISHGFTCIPHPDSPSVLS